MNTSAKPNEQTILVNLKLPRQTHEQLRQFSKSQRRAMGAQAVIIVENFFAKAQEQKNHESA